MRRRVTLLTASLLGVLALPSPSAWAQDLGSHVQGDRVKEMISREILMSPSLEVGWWRAITTALDGMRGLRGHRIPPLTARQVDLGASLAPTEAITYWQQLPPVTRRLPFRLDLRFGPVRAVALPFEPVTAWVADLRGESGDLLGAGATLPWLVP